MSDPAPSLQELHAPEGVCFGCGPANPEGLHLASHPPADGDPRGDVTAVFEPGPWHQAFEGVINGGILGTILDCHGNWAAAWHLLARDGLDTAPTVVTADFHVRLKRPTPAGRPLHLAARAVASEGRKVTVEGEVVCDGEVTATLEGRFVAVGPDHPAHGKR